MVTLGNIVKFQPKYERQIKAYAGKYFAVKAQLRDYEGNLIKQNGVTALSCSVYKDNKLYATLNLNVSEVVFDFPKLDSSWTVDNIGYNFQYVTSFNEKGYYKMVFFFTKSSLSYFAFDVEVFVE